MKYDKITFWEEFQKFRITWEISSGGTSINGGGGHLQEEQDPQKVISFDHFVQENDHS